MELVISIEIGGRQTVCGNIVGNDAYDAVFSYNRGYLDSDEAAAISISLPLREEPFPPAATRTFFEGLLPEGFTRRTVAEWIKADEHDYLRILSALGNECLGAIRVAENGAEQTPPVYEKLSLEQVRALAREGAEKSAELIAQSHISLAGASGKAGLYYDDKSGVWYLPKGSAPSTHIVKQSHIRLGGIVANEQLSLLTARRLGIDVPDTFIINTGDFSDSDVLFATRRYDRIFADAPKTADGVPVPLRLHQEDFAQAMGIPSENKYERPGGHYFAGMMELLRRFSSDPIRDRLKLWDINVFNFLIGNTDAHIKNFSLLRGQNIRSIRLAPAYDIISTTIYPNTSRNMAFAIGGKYDISEIGRDDFERLAEEAEMGRRPAMRRLDELAEAFPKALTASAEELAEEGFEKASEICGKILETGGIRRLR